MSKRTIAQQHLDELVRDGFTVVRGLLRGRELKAAQAGFLQYFPGDDELRKTPQRYGGIFEEGEQLQVEFPFENDALNDVATHPMLIDFVERALGTREIVLTQSAIWAKYAGAGDYEQGLHLDYQGNTLVVPRDDGSYRQVNMILYYSDVDETLGPTCVVPADRAKGVPVWPTHHPVGGGSKLYRHERPILASAGDLLIFSMRTWHRASAVSATRGARFSHHFIWRAAGHAFQGFHLWSRSGESPALQRFITRATPRQREVLGFPRADDPYWNDQTRAEVRLRYPGIRI